MKQSRKCFLILVAEVPLGPRSDGVPTSCVPGDKGGHLTASPHPRKGDGGEKVRRRRSWHCGRNRDGKSIFNIFLPQLRHGALVCKPNKVRVFPLIQSRSIIRTRRPRLLSCSGKEINKQTKGLAPTLPSTCCLTQYVHLSFLFYILLWVGSGGRDSFC